MTASSQKGAERRRRHNGYRRRDAEDADLDDTGSVQEPHDVLG
jgi:hypothetical protein